MSKTTSIFSALLCTFIWGTTFIAQDTGMDDIGPFTFNAVRFFVGFLAIIHLAILFEVNKFRLQCAMDYKDVISNDKFTQEDKLYKDLDITTIL